MIEPRCAPPHLDGPPRLRRRGACNTAGAGSPSVATDFLGKETLQGARLAHRPIRRINPIRPTLQAARPWWRGASVRSGAVAEIDFPEINIADLEYMGAPSRPLQAGKTLLRRRKTSILTGATSHPCQCQTVQPLLRRDEGHRPRRCRLCDLQDLGIRICGFAAVLRSNAHLVRAAHAIAVGCKALFIPAVLDDFEDGLPLAL
mmetsp:Transcript_73106/g.156620  ORF Transcript_73106/g.156620 Transcript_73106/m.156620 type:complete len:203 (+) Transcript_73106:953-1561(+)